MPNADKEIIKFHLLHRLYEKGFDLFSAFNNDNRRKIMILCGTAAKRFNISQISRILKLPYNTTLSNIEHLKKLGLVHLDTNPHLKNKPTYVTTDPLAFEILESLADQKLKLIRALESKVDYAKIEKKLESTIEKVLA